MNLQKEFRTLILPVFRGLPFIVLIMAVAFFIANHFLAYAKPMYQASAAIKLDNRDLGLQNFEIFENGKSPAFTNNFLTEVELFHSTNLIRKAFDSLNFDLSFFRMGKMKTTELYREIPFEIDYEVLGDKAYDRPFYLTYAGEDQFYFSTIEDRQGKKISCGKKYSSARAQISFELNKNKTLLAAKPHVLNLGDKFSFQINSTEKLMEGVDKNNLFVKPIDKEIYIVKVYYQHEIAEKAALFVNALIDAYLAEDREVKNKRAQTTLDFIDDEIATVEKELYRAEKALARFRKKYGVINTTQETDAMLRQFNEYTKEKLHYDIQEVELRNVFDFLSSDRSLSGFSPDFRALNDEVMQNTYVTMKNLELERMGLLSKHSLQSLEVSTVNNKINALKEFTKESIEKKLINITGKKDEVAASIKEMEKEFKLIPDKERRLLSREREFQLQEQTYKLLVNKRSELGVVQSSNVSFHKVIDYATPPKKTISPNKPLMIGLALLVGLIIGLFFAYVWHFFRARLNAVVEIEELMQIPVLAAVPKIKKKALPTEAVLPLFRQMQEEGLISGGKIITISSTVDGEGKSTIASALAQLMSGYGKKVLLVDMDFDAPNPAYAKEAAAALGFSDYLQQKNIDSSTLGSLPLNGADLLRLGRDQKPSSVAISSPSTEVFFRHLRTEYDVLLIDTPPLKNKEYASAIYQHGDVNLMVFKKNKTFLRELKKIENDLATCSVTNNYVVLNGF